MKARGVHLQYSFEDDGQPWFCPDCAMVEGFLSYFHAVREEVLVTYSEYPRPRQRVVDLVGEANQGMPVLVLGDAIDHPDVQHAPNGRAFVCDAKPITRYLAARYGVAGPHP